MFWVYLAVFKILFSSTLKMSMRFTTEKTAVRWGGLFSHDPVLMDFNFLESICPFSSLVHVAHSSPARPPLSLHSGPSSSRQFPVNTPQASGTQRASGHSSPLGPASGCKVGAKIGSFHTGFPNRENVLNLPILEILKTNQTAVKSTAQCLTSMKGH